MKNTSENEVLANVTDAHSHLWSPEFSSDRAQVLQRASDAGLVCIVDISYDVDPELRKKEARDLEIDLVCVAGVHPHDAKDFYELEKTLLSQLSLGSYSAIGEIGLDYYRNLSPQDQQITVFQNQLELAIEHDLPVVIHSRNADRDTYQILEEWAHRVPRNHGFDREIGMIHCFSSDPALAQKYIELGFLISISGIATFENVKEAPEVVRHIETNKLLVETDAPYLAPVPHRGKRNEPALVVDTIKFVSALKKVPSQKIADSSTQNAYRLFRLNDFNGDL
ncbi:MAG TPA: TatD family deoxyribonuclease [Dehalococcoidia bacterium]|nr:TatD family deoxyribonuclease [Dehalococcoidia bacterium]